MNKHLLTVGKKLPFNTKTLSRSRLREEAPFAMTGWGTGEGDRKPEANDN